MARVYSEKHPKRLFILCGIMLFLMAGLCLELVLLSQPPLGAKQPRDPYAPDPPPPYPVKQETRAERTARLVREQEREFQGDCLRMSSNIEAIISRAPLNSERPEDWRAFAQRKLTAAEAECVQYLSRCLRDAYFPERYAAARSIGKFAHVAALDALLETLANPYDAVDVREHCVQSLAKIADPRVVPALIECLRDPRIGYRTMIELTCLTGNPAGVKGRGHVITLYDVPRYPAVIDDNYRADRKYITLVAVEYTHGWHEKYQAWWNGQSVESAQLRYNWNTRCDGVFWLHAEYFGNELESSYVDEENVTPQTHPFVPRVPNFDGNQVPYLTPLPEHPGWDDFPPDELIEADFAGKYRIPPPLIPEPLESDATEDWRAYAHRDLSPAEDACLRYFSAVLRDPLSYRRIQAAEALGAMGHVRALVPLQATLRNRFDALDLREKCVTALSRIADWRTAAALIECLGDFRLGHLALVELTCLTGNPLGLEGQVEVPLSPMGGFSAYVWRSRYRREHEKEQEQEYFEQLYRRYRAWWPQQDPDTVPYRFNWKTRHEGIYDPNREAFQPVKD